MQCEIPEPCQRQEDTSDLQFSANLACKWLIIFVAMDWHHDIYLLNLIAVKLQCKTMNLSSSSSVHRQWCNHSMIEMVRSLGSCQGSVEVVISTGANCSLNHVKIAKPKTKHYFKFQWEPGGCGLRASRISSGGECHGQASPGRLQGGPGYGKEVKLQKGKDEDP